VTVSSLQTGWKPVATGRFGTGNANQRNYGIFAGDEETAANPTTPWKHGGYGLTAASLLKQL
jgi:hypothetical protein